MTSTGHFTQRFEKALVYATRLHNGQSRKSTQTPYVAHLLAVTAYVIEWGGDEDMAISGLLHDAVEDQGGRKTLDEIRRRFGQRVATIVEMCSETLEIPKPPWRQRKEAYLHHLTQTPHDALIVSLADKMHNATSILRDLRRDGLSAFERFNGEKDGTLWYYHTLVKIFKEMDNSVFVDEFARVVEEIDRLVGESE
jgi:GTP pyrophosphokinase